MTNATAKAIAEFLEVFRTRYPNTVEPALTDNRKGWIIYQSRPLGPSKLYRRSRIEAMTRSMRDG